MLKRANRELIPLLTPEGDPSEQLATLARNHVHKLVVEGDSGKAKVDRFDQACLIASYAHSTHCLPGYATLDWHHISEISTVVSNIDRYVDDVSQKRLLNFLMLAAPGAGKSHFIRCIAKRLQSKNVSAITFNMASRQSHEDLIPPLDAARNLKVEDRIPLLFLDEFDSSEDNYALLLPLLWDGELNIGQRHLKLGKVVIVLAGSSPSLPVTMDHARSMRVGPIGTNGHSSKLIDLFSRINGGVLSIPPFLDRTTNIDRRADKVCVAIHLLRQSARLDRLAIVVGLALAACIAIIIGIGA